MTPPAVPDILGGRTAPGHIAVPRQSPRAAAGGSGDPQASYVAGPRWLWAVPVAVTLAVVLCGIQRPSYWRDEAATLAAVRRPFGDMVGMLGNVDAVHGVYYMMMWVVVRLAGTGELATRLPSALAMAAAAAGVAATGRRLISPWAGLFAGLLFAALPEVSLYGQDARPYALVTALATTASYLLNRVLGAGQSRRGWLAAYGLALTAAGLVNILALALIPAHGLTVAVAQRRQRSLPARRSLLAGWLAAAAVAAAVASPLIAAAWAQRGQEHWLKKPGLRMLAALRYLVGPSALVIAVLLVIGCAVAVSVAGGRARARADWPAMMPALCLPWLLLPPAVLLAGSLIQPAYTLRYVLFTLPALALLGGAALAALGRAAGAIALVVVVLIGVPAQAGVRWRAAHGDNIRMADSIVAGASRPGDAVLYASAGARNMAAAYPYGLAALRNIALGRAPIPAGTLAGTYLPAAAVRGRLSGVRRTWVVEVGGARPVRLPLLQGAGFRLLREWRPSGIWLLLYQHRDKPYRGYRGPRRAHPAAGTRRPP
jgi:mannosyltransferase